MESRRKAAMMAKAQKEAEAAADERDDGGFGKRTGGADVASGGAKSFADADFAGALRDGDEHDVHDAYAAEGKSQQSDGGEEDRHDVEDAVSEPLDAVERIPDPECIEIDGIEVVGARRGPRGPWRIARHVQLRRHGCDDNVVHVAGERAFEVGREVALHRGEGNEHLRVVRAGAVAAVLLLLFEHADDDVRVAGDGDGLADGRLAGEELALGVCPEDDDAGAVVLIVL